MMSGGSFVEIDCSVNFDTWDLEDKDYSGELMTKGLSLDQLISPHELCTEKKIIKKSIF